MHNNYEDGWFAILKVQNNFYKKQKANQGDIVTVLECQTEPTTGKLMCEVEKGKINDEGYYYPSFLILKEELEKYVLRKSDQLD